MSPLATLVASLALLLFPCHAHLRGDDQNVSTQGTVNFLFMLRDTLPHADVWRSFFFDAPHGSWRGWVHCINFTACENDEDLKEFGFQLVSTVPSRWCDDLVTPMAHLMGQALAEPPARPEGLEKFVLLSEATLPIKPFDEVMQELLSRNESDVCMRPTEEWPEAKVNGTKLRLVKHSQWVVLTREDATQFVLGWPPSPELNNWSMPILASDGRADLPQSISRSQFMPLDAPHGKDARCADEEAVFALLFGAVKAEDVEATMEQSRCHTYIEWRATFMYAHGITPRVFYRVDNELVAAGRATPFLFARKFAASAELTDYADIMFTRAGNPGRRVSRSREHLKPWGTTLS